MPLTLHYYQPGQAPFSCQFRDSDAMIEQLAKEHPPTGEWLEYRAKTIDLSDLADCWPCEIVTFDGHVVGAVDAPINAEVEAILIERGHLRSHFATAAE